MDVLEVLLVLAVAIVAIYVWYLISKEFYFAAVRKGFPHRKYLWLTFFLGLIGILLVIALPDRGDPNTAVQAKSSDSLWNDLPDL